MAQFDLWDAISDAIRKQLGPTAPISDTMIREVLTRIESKDRITAARVRSGYLLKVDDLRLGPKEVGVHVPCEVGTAYRREKPVPRPAIVSEGW